VFVCMCMCMCVSVCLCVSAIMQGSAIGGDDGSKDIVSSQAEPTADLCPVLMSGNVDINDRCIESSTGVRACERACMPLYSPRMRLRMLKLTVLYDDWRRGF
jgi:hypothetical protein